MLVHRSCRVIVKKYFELLDDEMLLFLFIRGMPHSPLNFAHFVYPKPSLPDALCSLPNLEHLDISENQIKV
jgi:hypothetical protein